jgi:hypothetical protein
VYLRGIRYLARLLAHAEFQVEDLVGVEQDGPADTTHSRSRICEFGNGGDAGEMLDRREGGVPPAVPQSEDDLGAARALGCITGGAG